MKFGRIALSAATVCIALATAVLGAPQPDPKSPQYIMGYQAGRRDERADLCGRFEKHSALAVTLLGEARMVLIRAFCTKQP